VTSSPPPSVNTARYLPSFDVMLRICTRKAHHKGAPWFKSRRRMQRCAVFTCRTTVSCWPSLSRATSPALKLGVGAPPDEAWTACCPAERTIMMPAADSEPRVVRPAGGSYAARGFKSLSSSWLCGLL
jgi:hypothetical protein